MQPETKNILRYLAVYECIICCLHFCILIVAENYKPILHETKFFVKRFLYIQISLDMIQD